jgi:hypothetical protein
MVRILREKHIDTERYGIGYVHSTLVLEYDYRLTHLFRLTKLREIREGMGLLRTRQQGHSIESIRDAMIDLRHMYPKAGIREVISLLFHERDMSVSRSRTSLLLLHLFIN